MRILNVVGVLLVAFSASAVMADGGHHRCPKGSNCFPKKREACFTAFCSFQDLNQPPGFQNCRAAATFNKAVTVTGGEVVDDSDPSNNPQFEVVCDDSVIYNNSALRFTDLLGTRIQAEAGPYPALLLPRGALHSGANFTSGNHSSQGVLLLDTGNQIIKLRSNSCEIWSAAIPPKRHHKCDHKCDRDHDKKCDHKCDRDDDKKCDHKCDRDHDRKCDHKCGHHHGRPHDGDDDDRPEFEDDGSPNPFPSPSPSIAAPALN